MAEEGGTLKSLSELFAQGKIDRRSFISLAAATGVASLAARRASAASIAGGDCLTCHGQAPSSFTVDPATAELITRAHALGIDLVWDRGSPCQFSHKGGAGAAGLCCFRCQMGPCTLGEATRAERGSCGATRDVIAARDLVRRIAGGTAAHVEHARAAARVLKAVATGAAGDYELKDTGKLAAVYAGLGCTGAIEPLQQAAAVAERTLADLNQDEGVPAWMTYKASAARRAVWAGLGITPTGAGAEICEAEHRTTMGVDGDMVHLATDALKLGLVDGYCGLHAATGIQDVLFGTPRLSFGKSGLGVLSRDQVNLVVHGHEPLLSEMIVEAVAAHNGSSAALKVNVVGVCCTGNETLMRHGVPSAGGMVQQELAVVTGAVDAMVVDVQCIMPNVQRVAESFHTKIVTTNPQAQITGATYLEFRPEEAEATAAEIVRLAVENYAKRRAGLVRIPVHAPKDVVAGFSVEQIVEALAALNPGGDPLEPLLASIASGAIRGIVAVVGCVTPRDDYGYRHVALTRRLLAENVLVVGTGCWAHVAGQYGLLAADPAYPGVGEGLKGVLAAVAQANGLLALPACWHMGSCVDNSRIEDVVNAVVDYLRPTIPTVDVPDLPIAASAPEFITEKAVAIGTWAVDLGIFTHVGGQPYVQGSANLTGLLTEGVAALTGGKFYVETDPEVAADAILAAIDEKRRALGFPV